MEADRWVCQTWKSLINLQFCPCILGRALILVSFVLLFFPDCFDRDPILWEIVVQISGKSSGRVKTRKEDQSSKWEN